MQQKSSTNPVLFRLLIYVLAALFFLLAYLSTI